MSCGKHDNGAIQSRMLTLTCTLCQPQHQRTTHGGQGWSSPRWSPAWWGLLPQTTSDCPPPGWVSPEQTLDPYPRRRCTLHGLWYEVQWCLLYIYHIRNDNWLKMNALILVHSSQPLTSADDGPWGSIVDHLLVGFCGAGCGLELDDPVLWETQVHSLRLLHEECHLAGSVMDSYKLLYSTMNMLCAHETYA